MLRGLIDDDDDERQQAHDDGVLGSLWHQGTIYSATAPATRFLATLISDVKTPSRGRIGLALALIAVAAKSAAAGHARAGRREDGDAILAELAAAMPQMLTLANVSFELRAIAVVALAQLADPSPVFARLADEPKLLAIATDSARGAEAAGVYIDRFEAALGSDDDDAAVPAGTKAAQKRAVADDIDRLNWDADWESK